MTKLIPVALFALTAVFTQSCFKCKGVDQIYNYYAANVVPSETTVILAEYYKSANNLKINPEQTVTEGDRSCIKKNLVSKYGEVIQQTDLKVFCNRDMQYPQTLVAAGTNLLDQTNTFKITIQSEGTNFTGATIELDRHSMEQLDKGEYIFTVEGKTTGGTEFKRSATVTYQ